MALKDDPKVQELVAKAVAKAQKDAVKAATTSVKATFASLISDAEGDKDAVKTLKAAQKEVVNGLKAAPASDE